MLGPGPPAVHAEPAAPVRVALPERAAAAETLRLPASVTSARRAGLSPRVSGLVAAVHVDAGDRVAQGDVLLQLDETLARLALDRALASLAEAKARLAEARRLLGEAQKLVVDRHVPETLARSREAEVDLNAASVARLEAEVRESRERLARHALVAPFEGTISQKGTEAGEWVETGTSVLELVDTDQVRIDVQVPQERFGRIDDATPVTVETGTDDNEAVSARLLAKVPVNDPEARTFLVRVEPTVSKDRFLPGMAVDVTFAIRGEREALRIPRDALLRQADGQPMVWVVQNEGDGLVATPRTIELGQSLAETVEVLSGMEPSLRVIVRGNERLLDGQAVEILDD